MPEDGLNYYSIGRKRIAESKRRYESSLLTKGIVKNSSKWWKMMCRKRFY